MKSHFIVFLLSAICAAIVVFIVGNTEVAGRMYQPPYYKFIEPKPVPYMEMISRIPTKPTTKLPPNSPRVARKIETGTFVPLREPTPQEIIREYDWNAEHFIKIAYCESGMNLLAHNHTRYENSVGIFQVNIAVHPYTHEDMHDIEKNVAAAYEIYKKQGYYAWKNCSRKLGLL